MEEEKTIKRYVVFAGMNEHPRGGWSDYQQSFDRCDAAVAWMHSIGFAKWQWCQIIDLQTGNVIIPSDQTYMR